MHFGIPGPLHLTADTNPQKDKNTTHHTRTTGIKKMRNAAAAALAVAVFHPTLRSFVASMEFIRVNIPVLAAVSPNRDIGPWINAGRTPR